MPLFIVLHTTTPEGTQRAWTELGRAETERARAAFREITANVGRESGEYLVLPMARAFTASVTVTERDAPEPEGEPKPETERPG